MSYPFDPPPGDVGSLEAGARALGKLATDLSNQAKSATSAAGIALQEWQAPRADDFRNATQALVDELDIVVTATGNTANVIVNYATALQTAITNIATFKQKYDAAVVMSKGPGNTTRWATLTSRAFGSAGDQRAYRFTDVCAQDRLCDRHRDRPRRPALVETFAGGDRAARRLRAGNQCPGPQRVLQRQRQRRRGVGDAAHR